MEFVPTYFIILFMKVEKKILIIIKEREILEKDPSERKTNMKPIKIYNVNDIPKLTTKPSITIYKFIALGIQI